MLLLFENTLIHYIYIVFYTLISRAHPAHNLGNFYAMSRHATPTTRADRFKPGRWAHPHSDLSSFAPMSNHAPNDIRAHNNRHAIANDPDNLHAMSNHNQNDTQGAHLPQHHHPARLSHI